jgi:thiol:disulfide interchange protein DsbD
MSSIARRRSGVLAVAWAAVALATVTLSGVGSAKAGEGWLTSYEEAKKTAAAEQKPLFIDMWAEWCVACKDLARTTFEDPAVVPLFDGFVRVKLDMDAKENEALWQSFSVSSLPQVFFVKPDGTVLSDLTLSAFEAAGPFAERLKKARTALNMAGPGPSTADTPNTPPANAVVKGPEPAGGASAPTRDESKLHPSLLDLAEPAVYRNAQLTVRLVTDTKRAALGSPMWAGVHFHLEPGWHIYWAHPGDSGLPTAVNIRGEGVEASPLHWPMPTRFDERDTLTTYGYAGEALLPIPLRVADSAKSGDVLNIEAEVSWLVCEKNCVPGKAKLSSLVPVGAALEPSVAAPLLLQWREREAQDAKAQGWTVTVDRMASSDGGARVVRFLLAPPSGAASLAGDDAHPAHAVPHTSGPWEVSDREVRTYLDGGAVRVDVPVSAKAEGSADGEVSVLVHALHGGKSVFLRATAPLSAAGDDIATISAVSSFSRKAAGPAANFWQMLAFALLGGIILNIMPCVLPVLSLKAMSLVKQAGEDKRAIWFHGLAYTAGVMGSFLALALVVVGLKASGELVGWGFQFQNPMFVTVLTAIVFGFSLSMFGLFELSPPAADLAHQATRRSGLAGSFFNGAFATLLATPCTAPFLGPAMGFAFSQPAGVTIAMFLVVGFGLALPFLILARYPALIRKIPRGGNWMDTFKHVMGFLLVATSIWLVDVLAHQVTPRAVVGVLAFLGAVAVAGWMVGRFADFTASTARRRVVFAAAAVVLAVAGKLSLGLDPASANLAPSMPKDGEIAWKPFSAELVSSLQSQGQTVFIDFTAAWCVTCKANESTAIETDEVRALMDELGVVAVKGDYTTHDATIAQWLQRYERVGVPLYVVLPGARPNDAIVLPELLTTGMVLDALKEAGPSRAPGNLGAAGSGSGKGG